MVQPQVILTDIEGTTTRISFVHDVLFPYASKALPDYVREHMDEPEVQAQIQSAAMEAGIDPNDVSMVIATLLAWIAADRKVTSLKALQGMVWETGYKDGTLVSHVYADAVDGLRRWHAAGIRLAVYSSGSVPAQKLLFGHTESGDLQSLFSGWFDTRIGNKREADSYTAIASALDVPASAILFLSDIGAELDAARDAGLQTVQLVREADGTQPADGHAQVGSFDEIRF